MNLRGLRKALGLSWAILGVSSAVLEGLGGWAGLASVLEHLGPVIGHFEPVLGYLGPYWACLGRSWGHSTPAWTIHSDSQDRFQFGCQKALLDDSCTHVHCLEVILGLSGPRLGRLGPVLGKSWGGLGRVLGGLEPVRGTIWSWSEWVLAGKLSALGGLGGQQQARHLFQRTVSHCQATFKGCILFC